MVALGLCLVPQAASADTVAIAPGTAWKDTHGNPIQAHGGGMIKVGSTYYWFGEDKTGESQANAYFRNVPCYSSTDLAHWTFVANVLTRQASGDLGPKRIIERPKVIYNQSTRQYVMYMHVDTPGHTATRVGVATSSTVCGSYSYRGSFQPTGKKSLDITLFRDDDGTAYLLSESRTDGLRVYRLSADYLRVTGLVTVLADFEAPALFKLNGRYYLLGSRKSGWRTNDNAYTTSTSLSGGWATWKGFAPAGTHTFNSQTTFVLPVAGSQDTTFMFMGDRWQPASLGTSPYIWLPLTVRGTTVSLAWHDRWFIDTATGAWHA
jgi:beta-xylosidase